MTLVLLGCNGQVGWELQRSLAPLGHLICLDRQQADLSQPHKLAATLDALQPSVIINAAAYTAVDKAESDTDLAYTINAEAPAILAAIAKHQHAWLVHYSTDYVFDGSGNTPWQETSIPAPLNHYGRSKLAGEQAIQASGCQYLLFRTSWVYAARGQNFVKTMLRLAQQREQLSVVADQWGTPTGAELIADVSALALSQAMKQPELAGLYHLSASGFTNWYDFARLVISYAERYGVSLKSSASAIQGIASSAYPTPAQRPLNSRLDCQRLIDSFGLSLPDWQPGVERVLQEILPGYQPSGV